MRMFFVFAFATTTFVLAALSTAMAITEYCPAAIAATQRFDPPNAGVYSVVLSAKSARTVHGSLLVNTSSGWYTVKFDNTPLVEFIAHFHDPYAKWQRTDYLSPPLYARFPPGVTKVSQWSVLTAQSTGDKVFHWDERGMVTCKIAATQMDPAIFSQLVVADTPLPSAYRQAPAPSDTVIDAMPVSLEQSLACDKPDEDAVATRKITPTFPQGIAAPARDVTVEVLVALSQDGRADDVWIYAPSGVAEFDRAALSAAANSTYRAAREFCFPAPGYYLYVVTFGGRR